MATILNTERSQYINGNIDIYTKNKVGQYSKFLDKTPIFVTYYHINQAMSRTDIGTGSIERELGPRSPIKFNKISQFPIYNIPELKPDLVYDETGADIELDCNDLVILPGTIKPDSGDYFLVSLPNSKQFLFRVNNKRYNTIQSNDFYLIDADISRVGVNLEETYLSGQIVETYTAVFENVGTEDRCFVKTDDINYLNNLSTLIDTLKDYYKNAFYIRDINSFSIQTDRFNDKGFAIWQYDPFVEAFINKAKIYYEANSESCLITTPADILDDKFDIIFDQTIFKALITRNIELMRPYCMYISLANSKRYSAYTVMGYASETIYMNCFYNLPIVTAPEGGDTNISTTTFDKEYISSNFLTQIIAGTISTEDYYQLIIFNYINNITMKIDKANIIPNLEIDLHNFIYLPMVICALQGTYKDYFKSEKEI